MKNLLKTTSLLLTYFLMHSTLVEAMDTTPLNTLKKTKAPIALKPSMNFIENVVNEGLLPERSDSPTLSPSTPPRKSGKRSISPLGIIFTKKPHTDTHHEMLKYAKKGNLTALKLQLDLHKQETLKVALGEILHAAISGNRFNIIRNILENYDVDVNYIGIKKRTPLLRASKKGSFAIVNHLIYYGADVNAQTPKGNTALHITAKLGHVDAMKLVLKEKKQLDIDAKNVEQKTPLYLAVENTQLNTFRVLKKHGAKITTIGQHGRNLLHAAVLSGYLPILSNLLETTKLDVNDRDSNSQTPLEIAQNNNDETLINVLVWYTNKRNSKSKD